MSVPALAAALPDGAAADLLAIVRISEEIKRIDAVADTVNLMAHNAIFLSRRAGAEALGFGVLSNELRRFAMDLQRQMTQLRETTYGSVATVTALVKQARLNNVLERARREATGIGRGVIDEFMRGRHGFAHARQREQIGALNRRLSQMIADTSQLVELGSVLARSAKIEAAYGGPFSAALMQVSSDFENTIGEIQRSLASLSKQREL